jgi:hypothetical protein
MHPSILFLKTTFLKKKKKKKKVGILLMSMGLPEFLQPAWKMVFRKTANF